MASTSHEHDVSMEKPSAVPDCERVVISGMSGLFPQSRHVKDFCNILYDKKNPISEETCRWKYSHPEVSNFTGNIPGLEYFDAQFFKVHYRLAYTMDGMSKKTLEMAYQAIYDAGISPLQLSGKKVGVYTGSCFSESEKASFYDKNSNTGFGIAGCSKTMFANRISYWLNAKGPSMSIDEACCSSLAALEQAFQAISRGECEAAIVGGANICLHPQSSLHYSRTIKICKDGKTKSFDENADGCARSEAINMLFLQKQNDAKRIYAEVLYVKNVFHGLLQGETGPRYGFYRDPMHLADFLKTFYKEAKVPPHVVEYVEAFGSAVPEVDRSELEAIEEVFCKNRRDPLLVGSVMSNIGYGEAASGISAIVKVLLGYQKGEIAANLHCENSRRDITAIRNGKMEIVTEHKKFERSYTAVNAISVTGVNAHVLLKGYYKPKDLMRYKSEIPHLVIISARQDASVQKILDDLKSRPIDPEELALFYNLHQTPISGHLGRGYTILGVNNEGETTSLAETVNYFDDAKHPLWFVYTGLGSQWAGMGTQLMRIPIFAAAIERCSTVLEPKGIDIVHIITSQDKRIFDNVLNSFVGIAAVQIGLTDILTTLGLVPDKIIGHSVGELGCAYIDGCLTAEEMILAAYYRGLVSVQTPFIQGSMAAIGLGYQKIKEILPPEIEVACHNGPESSTISGPADIMKEFVAKLAAKGIFAKEVPCSNIAYHSRYIAEAGPGLLKYLREVIINPKPRSERWLSTSIPQDKWNKSLAKYCSAEYHTNNLLSSVLFEETSRLVPSTAVLVEIAPHGLLQAILKRSLPKSCKHIPLTRRGHTDNALLVLDAIGKLYMEGYYPKIDKLYPKIEFPVSTGTPMLSHLVEWAHNEKWKLPLYYSACKKKAAATKNIISTHDDEHSYLKGHVIRGKNLYPFSAVLVTVWDTLAMALGKQRRHLNVEFRDVYLYAQPPLHDQRHLKLSVTLLRGTGSFEVLDDDRKVARGYIIITEDRETVNDFGMTFETKETLELNSKDVYRILQDRDYHYKDEFRSIHKVNQSYTEAQIIWNDNWVTFLDGILQLLVLRIPDNIVSQPVQIRRLNINVTEHFKNKDISVDGKNIMIANVLDRFRSTKCGGIIIEDVQFRKIPVLEESKIALKALTFVPRYLTQSNIKDILQMYLQMVSENINKDTINIIEILDSDKGYSTFEDIRNILDDDLGLTYNYKTVTKAILMELRNYYLTDFDLIIVQNLSTDDNLSQLLYRLFPPDKLIINAENSIQEQARSSTLYRIISKHNTNTDKVELVQWRPSQIPSPTTVVSVKSRSDFSVLSSTRKDLSQTHKLVVVSPYPPLPGLKDLIKEWRKETDRNQIYLIMVSENENLNQLPELDLAYSVLNKGVWGGEYLSSWQEKVPVQRGITLRSGIIGDLDSLQWVEKEEPTEPGIIVSVHYAAINKLDVNIATGVTPSKDGEKTFETSYCMDFSGITDSGERVMGILPNGAASSRIIARPELLWPVPKHWSLEDAVTVPSAYFHALYCYVIKCNFLGKYKILIHGGAGALGQAAIAIALSFGCEVFTTVSDIDKKKLLIKLFPELKEDHIGSSRDPTFGDMVLSATNAYGCHVVLCCLQGELKNISLKSSCNIVLDTVRIPSQEEFNFGLFHLTQGRVYTQTDFSSMWTENKLKDIKNLQLMLAEGIAKGYVRPLSRVSYPPHEVSRAFRLLATSRHRGRVVLRLRDSVPMVNARILCSPDACHVVICDEGANGVQLIDKLVMCGATKLVLHCPNVTVYLRSKIKLWEKQGVNVLVASKNLCNSKSIAGVLGESNCVGAVEGVYVVAANVTEQNFDKLTRIISDLDRVTRKLCPVIRYFAIVSAGFLIGQQTCLSRARDGLPATTLNIQWLKKDETENGTLGWNLCRSAINTFEQAICSSKPTLIAVPQRKSSPSLLQQISKLAEIDISEETLGHITLQDMDIELTKLPIIQTFLRNVHNIGFDEEDISKLTIQQIRNLDEVISGSEFKETRGLATFFSYIDPDELLATTEFVLLPTLISSGLIRDDDFDVAQRYFCIIPGMEGHHKRFRVLCEKLKMPAIVLQPGLDLLHESIQETAKRYAQLLLKKIKVKNNFYLLGYESGVLMALEVAAILEKLDMTGTVFCVGGTPEELHATLLDQISEHETEEKLQDAVARYMFSLMTINSEGLDQALANVSSWEDKVEAYVRVLLGKMPHSAHYARAWINAAYTRINQMRLYKSQPRQLRSKLILLRASSLSTGSFSKKTTTALMQRYSKQPVVVYQLRAPLAHATYDLRCGAIINRHLEDEIQQAYNESNLCVNYLTNPITFIDVSGH